MIGANNNNFMETNESLKERYLKAWNVLDEGNEAEALRLFEELAELGYADAMIDAADLILKSNNEAEAKKVFEYYQKASETIPEAYDRLCMAYYYGCGVVRSFAEAVRYGLLTIKEVPADKISPSVYQILGECYMAGLGTHKDVCLAKQYFEKAKQEGLEEDVKGFLDELSARYPFTNQNEIDLKVRKRSKWASFLLWATMLCSGVQTYILWGFDQKIYSIFCGFITLTCLLTLGWQKIGGYLLLFMLIVGFGTGIYSFASMFMITDRSAIDNTFITSILIGFWCFWISFFILLSLQKRRHGYALAWCSLMKTRDDGRNMIKKLMDKLLVYGTGPQYLSDSVQTRKVRIMSVCFIALSFVVALFAGWGMAMQDLDFDIEWNCFESPTLYVTLCIIGFFLQFSKKLYTHASYDTYDVYKDDYGKVKKIEKNNDILTVVEGQIIMPILAHLLIYPMIIGAIMYYLIMIGFAFIQGIMPFIFGGLIIASVYLLYLISKRLLARKYRVGLISFATLFFLFVYGIIITATGVDEHLPSISISTDIFESKPTQKIAPDLQIYDVKGKVKQVELQNYTADNKWNYNKKDKDENSSYTVCFDTEGVATQHALAYIAKGSKPIINRDSEGRIIKFSNSEHEGGDVYSFTYNSKGNIICKKILLGFTCNADYYYYYNQDNQIERITFETSDVDFYSKGEIKYTYTKFDEQGNWTERRVEMKSQITEEEETKKKTFREIDVRNILYYE